MISNVPFLIVLLQLFLAVPLTQIQNHLHPSKYTRWKTRKNRKLLPHSYRYEGLTCSCYTMLHRHQDEKSVENMKKNKNERTCIVSAFLFFYKKWKTSFHPQHAQGRQGFEPYYTNRVHGYHYFPKLTMQNITIGHVWIFIHNTFNV